MAFVADGDAVSLAVAFQGDADVDEKRGIVSVPRTAAALRTTTGQ
ncbi:MAG: hypothetical protein ACOC0F_02220 [archaeon]